MIQEMTPGEKRSAAGLALIYATRMLGLFMIMPVFTLYADHLHGYTPMLAGLAIGIYGLTQAVFQIPLGLLSDRIGRKPVITGGLLLFAIGGVVAATTDNIVVVILGRAIQGAGAISAAVMAMNADLTREEHRTKAMAMIGMGIGLAFTLSLITGPLLAHYIGLSGIFWLTTGLAIIGLLILHGMVPTPIRTTNHRDVEPVPEQFSRVLSDPGLLRLDAGIFLLHLIMTATFLALPLMLRDQLGIASDQHYLVYLGVLTASVIMMVPFIIVAEKYRHVRGVFMGAIACLILAETLLAGTSHPFTVVIIALVIYFSAFNILEALLPSLVSKTAHPDSKGTAMGVYSSSQFLGAFLGGTLSGWLMSYFAASDIFILCAVAGCLWLLVSVNMQPVSHLSSHLIKLGEIDRSSAQHLGQELESLNGVAEAVVVAEDGVAYLKVDWSKIDRQRLASYSVAS